MRTVRFCLVAALSSLIAVLLLSGLGAAMQALPLAERGHPVSTSPMTVAAGALVTVTLTPAKDSTIYEEAANSGGSSVVLFSGRTNGGQERRTLLAFDLSQFPADAQILSATLRLQVSKTSSPTVDPFALYRLTRTWGEAGSSSTLGQGAPAQPGDATWEHAVYTTTAWSNAGGDFAASASATTQVGATGSYRWSSAALLADVQAWVAAPAANFGWVLVGEAERNRTARQFVAREGSNVSNRPQLVIVYEDVTPEPTSSLIYLPLVQK